MHQELKRKKARLGEDERTQISGAFHEVTATDGQKYRGRLLIISTDAIFEEDRTYFRVTVPNAVDTSRIGQRDRRICVGLRGLHIQRRINESQKTAKETSI